METPISRRQPKGRFSFLQPLAIFFRQPSLPLSQTGCRRHENRQATLFHIDRPSSFFSDTFTLLHIFTATSRV